MNENTNFSTVPEFNSRSLGVSESFCIIGGRERKQRTVAGTKCPRNVGNRGRNTQLHTQMCPIMEAHYDELCHEIFPGPSIKHVINPLLACQRRLNIGFF